MAALALVLARSDRPMAGHNLVYSERDRAVLLIDGDAAGPRPILKLVANGWTPIPNSNLPARSLAAAAADEEGNILLHGGAIGTAKPGGGTDFRVTAETWRWDGKAWKLVSKTGPAPRDHHAMAYDGFRKRFVLFGGSDADPSGRSKFFGDTWEWDGKNWINTAARGPSARCHHAMVYDPARRVTLMVGGYGANGSDPQTWAWDGKSWIIAPSSPVATRSSPRITYDASLRQVVLFGGSAGKSLDPDTWGWDGKSWKRLALIGPEGRTVHAIAYDAARNRTILYGGAAGNDVLGDVWQFNGHRWTPVP